MKKKKSSDDVVQLLDLQRAPDSKSRLAPRKAGEWQLVSEPFYPSGRGLPLEIVHLNLGGPVLDHLAQHIHLLYRELRFQRQSERPTGPLPIPMFLDVRALHNLVVKSDDELGRQSGGAQSPHGVGEVDRIKGVISFAHTHTWRLDQRRHGPYILFCFSGGLHGPWRSSLPLNRLLKYGLLSIMTSSIIHCPYPQAIHVLAHLLTRCMTEGK